MEPGQLVQISPTSHRMLKRKDAITERSRLSFVQDYSRI